MFWLNSEDSRCVKPWEAESEAKSLAKTCVALSPQKDFLIATKVGDLDPRLHSVMPPESYAEYIVRDMIKKGMGEYTFEQTVAQLERDWGAIPPSARPFFAPVEIFLIQRKSEGIEEEERSTPAPVKRELAHT